jgi:hypothetical protein
MDTVPEEDSEQELLPLAGLLQKTPKAKEKKTCFNQYKLKHEYTYRMKSTLVMQSTNTRVDSNGKAQADKKKEEFELDFQVKIIPLATTMIKGQEEKCLIVFILEVAFTSFNIP